MKTTGEKNLLVRILRDYQVINFMKLIIMLGFSVLIAENAVAKDTVIKTYSGSGGKNTRPFTVKDGWEIQWDADGDIFQLYLYTSTGDLEGVPANQMGSGEGASYQAKGGQFYIQVNAMGKWTITIIQTSEQVSNSTEENNQSNSSSESPFQAKTGTPVTAIAAAAWSCVENILQDDHVTSAPN